MRRKDRKEYLVGYNLASAMGGWQAVQELIAEGYDSATAIRLAATEIDGAGDNGLTVESMATCRDLGGRPIPGVTSYDSVKERRDRFADTAEQRRRQAELGQDEAARWLRNRNR